MWTMFCVGQTISTDMGGARGADGLRAPRKETVKAESDSRRIDRSGCAGTHWCGAAASALGESGDRLRVLVHTPHCRGASRIGVPALIFDLAGSPSSALVGA
jgi:hypothetical protein